MTRQTDPNAAHKPRSLKSQLTYWLPTGLLLLGMTAGGLGDALCSASALEVMHQLGYPDYFTCWLGIAKLLGVVALLAPVPRMLREWAYAGFVFDVLGATVSSLSSGHGLVAGIAPLVMLVIILLSRRAWLRRLEPQQERASTHSSALTSPAALA